MTNPIENRANHKTATVFVILVILVAAAVGGLTFFLPRQGLAAVNLGIEVAMGKESDQSWYDAYIVVRENNTLPVLNSVASEANWAVKNMSDNMCYFPNWPLRYGISEGYYALNNLSFAHYDEQSCGNLGYPSPLLFSFYPHSSVVNVTSRNATSEWNLEEGGDYPVQGGVAYTVVAEDEWGRLALLHFSNESVPVIPYTEPSITVKNVTIASMPAADIQIVSVTATLEKIEPNLAPWYKMDNGGNYNPLFQVSGDYILHFNILWKNVSPYKIFYAGLCGDASTGGTILATSTATVTLVLGSGCTLPTGSHTVLPGDNAATYYPGPAHKSFFLVSSGGRIDVNLTQRYWLDPDLVHEQSITFSGSFQVGP